MESLKLLGKRLFAYWMKFAHILGTINTALLLTLVYFIPFGIVAIARKFAASPLAAEEHDGSLFQAHAPLNHMTVEMAERQF